MSAKMFKYKVLTVPTAFVLEPYSVSENQGIGAVNYITRYAGTWRNGEFEDVPDVPASTWSNLRSFILDGSDTSDEATEDLKKITSYTVRNLLKKPETNPTKAKEKIRKSTSTVVKSIKCPPTVEFLANVSISDEDNKLLFDNLTPRRIGKDITATISSFQAQLVTKKGPNGGLPPSYIGSYTLKFVDTNPFGGDSILQKIAEDENLNYVFRPGNQYAIQLSNKVKSRSQIRPQDLDNCNALINEKIFLTTTTLKHELSNWNPVAGVAEFTINFAVSKRTKEIFAGAKTAAISKNSANNPATEEEKKAQNKQKATSLLNAIRERLKKNNSLFDYSIRTKPIDGRTEQRIFNIVNGDLNEQAPEGSLLVNGEFFLFRSLVIATLQAFSRKHSPLQDGKNNFLELYDNKEYDNIRILLDETTVPNELGDEFTDPGIDVRSTYETIAINFDSLREHMEELLQKQQFISFPDLVASYINVLIPKVMQRCIVKGQTFFQKSFGAGKTNSIGFFKFKDKGRILNGKGIVYQGKTYKPQSSGVKPAFFRLNEVDELLLFREQYRVSNFETEVGFNALDVLSLKKDSAGYITGIKNIEVSAESNTFRAPPEYGRLKVKRMDEKVLTRLVIEALPTSPLSYIMFKRKDDPLLSTQRLDPSIAASLNVAERLDLGIIDMTWFDALYAKQKTDRNSLLKQSLNIRISSDNPQPFEFSVIENKDVNNMAAAAALDTKSIQYRLHSVTFTIEDVLGIAPYLTDWYFSPLFFGFDALDDDKFGYAGLYKTLKASIDLPLDKPTFSTNITAQLQFDPNRVKPKELKDRGTRTEEQVFDQRRATKKKLRALEVKLSKAKELLNAGKRLNPRAEIRDKIVDVRKYGTVGTLLDYTVGVPFTYGFELGAKAAADIKGFSLVSDAEIDRREKRVAELEAEVKLQRGKLSTLEQELVRIDPEYEKILKK